MSEGGLGVVGWAWGGVGAILATVMVFVAARDPVFADVDRAARVEAVASSVEQDGDAPTAKKSRPAASAGSSGGQKPTVFPNPFDDKQKTDDGGDVLPGQATRDAANDLSLKLRRNDLKGALASLEKLIELDKNAGKDPAIRESIVDLSQRLTLLTTGEPERMFGLLAKKMGPLGIDILYQLVTTRGGSRAAKISEDLLKQDEVLERGTPAMQIAWKLRQAKGCEEKKALFAEAGKNGDARTLGQLFLMNRSCGRRNAGCCLHKDPELEAAITALKARGFQ